MTSQDKDVKANPDEDLIIESLWILDDESGICIFEENYRDITKEGVSTDMIASFLSAILMFAGETFAEEIQHIKFKNSKIIFDFSDHFLLVIAVSGDSSDFRTKLIASEVKTRFNERFQDILADGQWAGGDISVFNPFSEDLAEIIEIPPLKLKLMQSFDLKTGMKRVGEFLSKRKTFFLDRLERIEQRLSDPKGRREIDKRIKRLLNQSDKFLDSLKE